MGAEIQLGQDLIVYKRGPSWISTSEPIDTRLLDWRREVGEVPGFTCPKIDEVKEACSEASKKLYDVDRISFDEDSAKADFDSVKDLADDAERCLRCVDKLMEDIRTANDNLRLQGHFWYDRTKELILEINKLKASAEKELA